MIPTESNPEIRKRAARFRLIMGASSFLCAAVSFLLFNIRSYLPQDVVLPVMVVLVVMSVSNGIDTFIINLIPAWRAETVRSPGDLNIEPAIACAVLGLIISLLMIVFVFIPHLNDLEQFFK
jgi:uncharacterized membrane-anchored protein